MFRRRRERTLSPGELCELMTGAQEAAYGDGLDPATLHPYMWALKPHYYGSHFYNWPYTYGLLFGLGLFAEYQRDPERFRGGYDDLLSTVGLADAGDARRPLRHRRARRGVLDREPGRHPRPHRGLRDPGVHRCGTELSRLAVRSGTRTRRVGS